MTSAIRRRRRHRPASIFLGALALLTVGLCLCYAHGINASRHSAEQAPLREIAVRIVGSSDLAVYNAARYLRHVTLTDVSTPFHDCPGCLDYFPEAMSANPPGFAGMSTQMSFGTP